MNSYWLGNADFFEYGLQSVVHALLLCRYIFNQFPHLYHVHNDTQYEYPAYLGSSFPGYSSVSFVGAGS